MAAVCLQNAFSPIARELLIGSGIAAQISNGHEPRNILGTAHFLDSSSSRGSRSKNVFFAILHVKMGGSWNMAPGAWPPTWMGRLGLVMTLESNKA